MVSFSQFLSSLIAEGQPHCAKKIICGSWYDTQQFLRAAVLLGRLSNYFRLSDSASTEDAVGIVLFSNDMQLNLQKCTNV